MSKKQFQQGDKVKFLSRQKKIKNRVIGHGETPAGVTVTHNGQAVLIEYGRTYQVSEGTSAAVANIENSPLPLINAEWLNGSPLAKQFKKLKTNTPNED